MPARDASLTTAQVNQKNPLTAITVSTATGARSYRCSKARRPLGSLPKSVRPDWNDPLASVFETRPTALELLQLCIGLRRLLLSQCHLSSLTLHRSDCRFADPARRTHRRSQR